jgi:LysR family transcriptional activator of nhaA
VALVIDALTDGDLVELQGGLSGFEDAEDGVGDFGANAVAARQRRIVLDHADVIFAAGEELLQSLDPQGGAQRRVLRIGSLATLSRNFQMQFVEKLLDREDVELLLSSGTLSELLEALRTHRIDCLLSNSPPLRDAASPWISHLISEQSVSLVGPKRRGARRQSPSKALRRLLSEHPLIIPGPDSSIRTSFDALVDRLGIEVRIAAEVDDMAMLRLLARHGSALAIVPPIVVADELEQGILMELVRIPELAETFYATTLRRRFPNPLLRELVSSD